MNPYQQGQSGYPPQPYLHNVGFCNNAPQSFGNPMPMPGFPTTGYPAPQTGYPNSQGYPQASQGYPQPGGQYPQTPQTGYPSTQTGYPQAQTAYPQPQSGYPQATQGYSPAGYPQASQDHHASQPNQYQGYPPHNQPHAQSNRAYSVSSPVSNQPKSKPTVVPVHPFDPRNDAERLRKAMKGFGTDEKTIIQILTQRSNEQRLRIAYEFKTLYGKDLVSDLKSETSGKFEDILVALMTPLPQYYAKELHDAISGIGTDEDVLIEVMCTMSNHEINVIKQSYTAIYGALLEDDLRGDTSGNFKRLMTSLCMGNRSEEFHVDQERAREDARSLLQAGELRLGTDESVFNSVLCSRSFPQLAAIFQEYHFLTGHDIDDAIKAEFSGDLEKALRAIVKVVRNKPLFFAERLHKSMKGLGTNDRQLTRIMVTRCELDLGDIADMFLSKYGETLQSWIEGDCSGHYKKTFLGELRLGTDESVFNSVLCSRSFPQLAAIFQEYHFLTGHDIDDAIKAEFSGDLEKALRAIVKVVRNKPLFFAERLHKSMKGLGTNDRQLTRIMVTRCELDLGDIADMFLSKYGETLQSWIEGDCSGHYKKTFLGLLGLY